MIELHVEDAPSAVLQPDQAQVIRAVSPTIDAERTEEGALLTIHDIDGTKEITLYDGPQGPQGEPGQDGLSPNATVTQTDTGALITVTDADGTTTAEIKNGETGEPGAPGADGVTFTPTVSAEGVISWTNDGGRTNPQPVDIKGPQGPQGDDYVLTAQDKQDIAELVDAPVQSVNNKTGAVVLDAQDVGAYEKPASGIPASDLAAGVIPDVPVQDVKVNGTSVVQDGVANVQIEVTQAEFDTLSESVDELESALKEDISNIYDSQIGTNKCNPDTLVVGSLKSDGTVDSTATSYKASDFIEVDPNSNYVFVEYSNTNLIQTGRKYCALYDSSKALISGSYVNQRGASSLSISTGETAKYLRVASGKDNKKMVVKGTTVPGDGEFEAYKELYISKLDYSDDSIPVSAINAEIITRQLIEYYDSTGNTIGQLKNDGGINTSLTDYKVTAPIKINKGIKYKLDPVSSIVAYYSDETAGTSSFLSLDPSSPTEIVSPYDGYMRVSFKYQQNGQPNPATTLVSIRTIPNSNTPTEKIEEGVSLSDMQIGQVVSAANESNVLYGKKWAVCGDSFTHGGGTGTTMASGKYKGENYTYPWIIGTRQNMTIAQFFHGGKTLAFPAEPGDFVNSLCCPTQDYYYQNIPADADYITIYLGINDHHHNTGGGDGEDPTGYIPLGEITDNTTASYYGAWNVVLSWLITNRPNAHIGIIVTNGIATDDTWRQAQIAIAQKYGIPYIDLNGDSRTPAMLRTSNPNIASTIKDALIEKWKVSESNTHPNDAAQAFEATFIENFLRSI